MPLSDAATATWPLARPLSERENVLDRFLEYVTDAGLELYPAQEEAVLELFGGKNVILNTPTGSGKSLVALALHFDALMQGRRSFYTSPIRALVNEKFFALCRDFGPENVGMITGDASVNPSAPIVCCTAEILMTDALRYGSDASVHDVVMDEFHYYSDRDRGIAWQIPLLTLPQTRFLLMSATIGDTELFEQTLTRLNGKPSVTVRSVDRPVPLDFQYSEYPLHEQVAKLLREDRAPIYLVSFTQRECAEQAQNFMSVPLCTKEEKRVIAEELEGVRFSSPYGKEFQKFLRHGMGIHHAGLLPKYRVLVEKLAQKGLLKIIFGTDTLGVGVNVPIRTVLLTRLCKFDGEKTSLLTVRDFHQICGRAGRKGFDTLGTVVCQAPEHVIENLRNEQKAAGDPKKLKKIVKRKPPEKGFVPWTEETFRKLIDGKPEPLVSRFRITHSMLLNVLSRPEGRGCDAMRHIIRECHEPESAKPGLRKTAFQLFRSLVERQIIGLKPFRLNVDLQEDFSLNHALSLFLVDAIQLLDRQDPSYALDVLTLAESILENPEAVLRKQLDRIKSEKMREMKAEGIEFEERIEKLEQLEYPKPNREFIYETFNRFSSAHPWVGYENIRPKSIAREMFENFHTFAEYVREYDLHRSEGVLLRYLSDVYKALLQNVPEYAMNDELYEISVYFGSIVRQVDSSLIDEWERMRHPEAQGADSATESAAADGEKETGPFDVTSDTRAFEIMVRNEAFQLVKALARGAHEPPEPLDYDIVQKARHEHEASGHSGILADPAARSRDFVRIEKRPDDGAWDVEQILADPDGHNDWAMRLKVDLEASRQEGRPVLRLEGIGAL